MTRALVSAAFIAAAIFCASAAPPACAETYQFVGPDGTVHFTNAPNDPQYRRMAGSSGTAEAWLRVPKTFSTPLLTDLIRGASQRHGVPEQLISAVIRVESGFNARAVSRKGARGLMQLMPATASSLSVRDSFDPYENIDGGVRHLRRLLDRFHGNVPLAVAAYNAGEQTVINYHGVPPYRETRRYVAKILRRINYRGVAVIYGSSNRRVVMTESTMRPQIRPAVYVPPTRPEPRPEPRREAEPIHRETVRPEPRREVLGPWAPTPMIRSVAASPRTSAIVSGVPSESP